MKPQLTDFPYSSDFPGGVKNPAFHAKMQQHFEWINFATGEVYGMLKVTPKFDTRPEWTEKAKHILTVQCPDEQPKDLEPVIQNLVGQATQNKQTIEEIAHGLVKIEEHTYWCLFARLSDPLL